MRWLKSFMTAFAAALISSHGALAQGPPMAQLHAYEGPQRPAAQIATVYGVRRFHPLGRTLICAVNGKSVSGVGGCRTIIYLLPGSHRLGTYYSATAFQTASGTITVNVAAGRAYELDSERAGDRIAFRVHEKPPGFVLTYKDVIQNNPMLSTTVGNMRIDPAQ